MESSPLEQLLTLNVSTLMFVFMRLLGLVLFAPIYSSGVLPMSFRFYLVMTASVLVSIGTPPPPSSARTMIDMSVMMTGELAIGMVMGAFVNFIFAGLQLAGHLSGTQLGLALASVVNPQFDDQSATTSVVYATVASLAFFITGLDRELFRAVLDSFEAIPLGLASFDQSMMTGAWEVFKQAMIFAVRIAAPVTVCLFLAEIAMAFVGRTVPQLNVLSVGFSVRILLGLVVTVAALPDLIPVLLGYIDEAINTGYQTLREIVPG